MLKTLMNKYADREKVSYLIFGVLTTLVDWISYRIFRQAGMDYRMATVLSQGAAILFAYITNKLWVFRSYNFRPAYLLKEMSSFFSCRLLTMAFTYAAMVVMVSGMGIQQDMICKIITSGISLVLNYIFSKLIIFKKKPAKP
ncbi:GtrA family protein [Lachnospiraceae bacterium 62-35]